MKRKEHNLKRTAGFSLIEIMVAVTLLAVITVGLLSMFYHTQKAFRLGAGQVDVLEGGRSTLQLLSRDLQEMYPSHLDEVPNLAVMQSGLPLIQNLPGSELRTNVLQDISFLTRRGDEWIGITYRVDHGGRGGGTLYRAFVTNNPYAAMPQQQALVVGTLFTDASKNVNDIPASVAPTFHRIADGVVHLRVRAYDQRGRLFAPGEYRLTNGLPPFYSAWTDGQYGFVNLVPSYIDIELGVLDPKGIAQFDARTDASARRFLEDQAFRVHLFTQRIPIRSSRSEFDLFVVR